jgi:hypothetical protein
MSFLVFSSPVFGRFNYLYQFSGLKTRPLQKNIDIASRKNIFPVIQAKIHFE